MKKLIMMVLASLMATTLLVGCSGGSSDEFSYGNDITVISREDGSGTRGAFVELTGIEEKNSEGNKVDRTTDEAVIANKTGVVLQNVASDIYSLGYISLGSLNDTVKALQVDGVEATPENIKNGSYAIARPFNIAYKGELSELADDFMKFILSKEGQDIVEEEGYIRIAENLENYQVSGLTGKITVAGSSSVGPVMEVLAEAYKELNTGVQIEIQVSDSSTGMQNAIDGICEIGMASRDLKDEEKSELTNVEIALDGIAVIVHKDNPVQNITSDKIVEIYTGVVTTWEEE